MVRIPVEHQRNSRSVPIATTEHAAETRSSDSSKRDKKHGRSSISNAHRDAEVQPSLSEAIPNRGPKRETPLH